MIQITDPYPISSYLWYMEANVSSFCPFTKFQIMSSSNLSALSIAELKVIAGRTPITGDKRKKQSWIDAIEAAQAIVTVVQSDDEFESVLFPVTESAPDDDTWNLGDAIADDAQQEVIAHVADEATAKRAPSPKKGAVSVAASIVCLLVFLLSAFCQTLAFVIKYTCLLVMLFGRWNPNLDIWYQLTQRASERKRLDIASA